MAGKSRQPAGLICKVKGCNPVGRDWLASHLLQAHSLTAEDYLAKHPGAETVAERLRGREEQDRPSNLRRAVPPEPHTLCVVMAGMDFR